MKQLLKCPNPSCSYVFDASAIPAGAILICPRCTMRFTLGPLAASASHLPPSPTMPTQTLSAPPSGTIPPPSHSLAATPTGTPAAASPSPTSPTVAAPPPESPLPSRTTQLKTIALIVIFALGLAVAGLAVWYRLNMPTERPRPGGVQYRDLNLALVPPSPPWEVDGQWPSKLGSPFVVVYRRDNPTAYVAIAARDYANRQPHSTELQTVLMAALGRITESGTLTQMPLEDDNWMGLTVSGFRFRAIFKDDSSAISGQALAASRQGIGYWFIAWTAESLYPEYAEEFHKIRNLCRLLDLRKDWKPTLPPAVPYKNTTAGYVFTDASHSWKEITDTDQIRGHDPNADKLLKLEIFPGHRRDLSKLGYLAAYVLQGGDDPLAVGRQYVSERRRREIKDANPELDVNFTELTDPPADAASAGSGPPTLRLHSRVKNASGQDRLHVLSAVRTTQGMTVVVHAWCDWADRAYFETAFLQIVRTLQATQ